MSDHALVRDIRYAVRRLLRDGRLTAAAVLIPGLAIGANTAISTRKACLPLDDGSAEAYTT